MSCPIVFVWNGQKYEFVSDVLGMAALGFFYEPGILTPVRSFERMLLPEGLLVAKHGTYQVKIGEPMEEVLYLDDASLHAYEFPQGWDMVLDERFNVNGPEATGRPIYFKSTLLPVTAFNQDDEDVTKKIVDIDRVAPDPGNVDTRFIGLLQREFQLTLSFDPPLPQENTILLADAWLEYPYSQTVFGAWQAGIEYEPVTVETWSESHGWRELINQFGYPAGMPRTMALPLPTLPEGVTKVRLRANMEIYWDRIRIALEETPPEMKHERLKMVSALTKRTGFALHTTGPQKLPYYDYDRRTTYNDAKYAQGFYTNHGNVADLVGSLDGAVAIVGSGEEIHMEFEPVQADVENGRQRRFVVDFRGWVKDMDMYTSTGEKVEPLPILRGLADEQLRNRERLHEKFNLRFQSGAAPF